MAEFPEDALGVDIQEQDAHNDGDGSLSYFMRENWGQYVAIYEALRILLTQRDNPEYAEFFETVDLVTESLAAAKAGPFSEESIELGISILRGNVENLRWRCDTGDQRACRQIPRVENQIEVTERALAKFRVSREVGDELWRAIHEQIPAMIWGLLTGWYDELTKVYEEHGIRGLANKIMADVVFLAGELFILCVVSFLTGGGLTAPLVAIRVSFQFTGSLAASLVRAGYKTSVDVIVNLKDFARRYGDEIIEEVGDIDLNRADPPSRAIQDNRRGEIVETDEPPPPGNANREGNGRREDERPDGSYRNLNDPEGVRRASDGEAMIEDRDGNWTPVSKMPRRDNVYTGRWGETVADRYAAERGWQKLNGSATTMNSGFTGPNRIDAVYYNPNPPPGPYIISDAKALGSGQGRTKDNVLQMSAQWIEDRLEKAGLTQDQIDDILMDRDAVLLRVDKNGNVTEEWLDELGNVVPQTWR